MINELKTVFVPGLDFARKGGKVPALAGGRWEESLAVPARTGMRKPAGLCDPAVLTSCPYQLNRVTSWMTRAVLLPVRLVTS